MRARLHDALTQCTALLGAEQVCTDPTDLARVNTATFITKAASPAILKPVNRQQVAACLRIASQCRVPVYAVSTGKNWGYGSAVAPADGCMLLSLAAINTIVAFDELTGRVRLEPGVTFHQLATFLRERGAHYQPPYTGSGAHTSVIGNTMERGIGKGLYEDMVSHVHACEALLANGEILRTSLDDSGPALLGLLPQGNLAIVVEITLQLEPEASHSQLITFPIHGAEPALMQAVRGLHDTTRRGAPRTQLAFLNDYRITSQIARFPHDTLDANAAVPRQWMQTCLTPWQGAQWIGACHLLADDADELAWRRNSLCAALAKLGLTARAELPGENVAPVLDDDGLRCAYWRKTFPMPSDPDLDRDRCGVIWVAPVLPLDAVHLDTFIQQLEATTLAHGFEPAIALRTGRSASIHLILGLFFDRDLAGADERALRCQSDLQTVLQQAHVPCYRHTLLDQTTDADPGVKSVLSVLKTHFDPHNILAPNRYHLP